LTFRSDYDIRRIIDLVAWHGEKALRLFPDTKVFPGVIANRTERSQGGKVAGGGRTGRALQRQLMQTLALAEEE
jgi:hypothetical protein